MTAQRPGEPERIASILTDYDFDVPDLACDAAPDLHEQSVKRTGVLPAVRRVALRFRGCGHETVLLTCSPCAIRYQHAALLTCWCGRKARRVMGFSVAVTNIPKQVAR